MYNDDDNDNDTMVMVSFTQESVVSASAWMKGISLSVLASIIGGASKLAIRKSWLIEQDQQQQHLQQREQQESQNQHQPLTATTDATIDSLIISSHIESDVHQSHSFSDDVLPTIQDDHYSSHHRQHHVETSPNRLIPIILRTCGMIGMTALNPLCSVLAMNYASPSILAPFSGLTLVWIVLFSEALVGEKPTVRQVIAAALIVLGEVVIAFFGDHTNDEGISLDEVVHSYHETSFICFIIAMSLWMIFLLYYMCSSARVNTTPTFQRFAWGVAGGSITGFQNFLKDSLTVLKASKSSNESGSSQEFPYLLFIFMFGMAIFVALSGLIILTLCMKRYDVTYSASMFVGSFCISASIMSAIHYDTFSHLNDMVNYIGYPSGLVILLYGVYMLLMSTSAVTTGGIEPLSRSNPSSSTTFVEISRRTEDGELS